MMKNLIRIMLIVTAVFAYTCQASAQHRRGGERISREQLAEKQAHHIAEELALSSDVSEKFIGTYMKCQREIWDLRSRQGRQKKSSMTDMQVDSVIQTRFDHSQKLLDIRKKYYAEYSKFLTARQIDRVYELERKMMKRLNSRRNSRK